MFARLRSGIDAASPFLLGREAFDLTDLADMHVAIKYQPAFGLAVRHQL